MRQCRDSFLRLLKDNLGGIAVHNVRREPNNPGSDLLKVNAVNVQFLDVSPSHQVGTTQAEIRVINEDELTALDWVKKVFDVLGSAYMTEKKDYTTPASPTNTGTHIYWSRNIRFEPVYSDSYYDFRCLLTLHHKVDT